MSFRTQILRKYVQSMGPQMAQTNYCCNLYENLHISEKCFDVNEQTLNMSSLLFIIQSKNTSAMKKVNLTQSRNFFAFSYVEAAKCGCLGKAIWYQKNKMFYLFMFWTFKITIRLWASLYMTTDKKILNLYMCRAICLLVCFYLSVTFCLLCYVYVF